MTSAKDQVSNTPPESFTQEEVAAVLEEVARTSAPSRFVLYGIVEDPDGLGYDGDLIAWGLGFDDHVRVQAIDSASSGTFNSTDSMLRIMCRDRDIRVLGSTPSRRTERFGPRCG